MFWDGRGRNAVYIQYTSCVLIIYFDCSMTMEKRNSNIGEINVSIAITKS